MKPDPTPAKTAAPRPRKTSTTPRKRASAKKKTATVGVVVPVWKRGLVLAAEVLALSAGALIAIISMLGQSAEWFGGTGLWANLLPFAAAVLVLALVIAVGLWSWLKIRPPLLAQNQLLPAAAAACVALIAGWLAAQPEFHHQLASLRGLVGGTEQAERVTLAHQVFAAYRRTDLAQMQKILDRSRVYDAVIREAAADSGMDAEVLVGVGAAESSFAPRDSKDGGRGLFQITAPPKIAVEHARKALAIDQLDLWNQQHNAFVAAATLRHYLQEMGGDLFLGLLAYNIGPRNGGLRSIMQQYGARDFVTIQPYLQNLPRDYPIRVLTAALAYRLWRLEGKLPRYEEGGNALRIQSIGIPGLDSGAAAGAKKAPASVG